MLELKFFHTDKDRIVKGYKLRNMHSDDITKVDRIIELDLERKELQSALDELNFHRNTMSKAIGDLYKSGQREEAEAMKGQASEINEKIESLDQRARQVKGELDDHLIQLPNIPHALVPAGKDDSENELVQAWEGPLPILYANAQPHWELADLYQLIDFPLGAQLSGSGFVVFRGLGAKLQRSLISFFLDEGTKAGYEEFIPPLLVNEDSARATGHLPDKEGQMYHAEKDNLFLIPTSELPLANLYRDQIVEESDLPIKVTSYTPCFRREAGSYGAHVKGLNRLHQFDKVEIVQITDPETSYQALDAMVEHVSSLLDKLELPYRIVRLCGGDLGFASTMTYDFEVYSAGQDRWLEVSSVSNCETFQANRLKLRIKRDKKNELAHTLNGSALALPRIIAALLENNQVEDGILIPEVLQPYTGFSKIS
jgi:seryl-tRNA synthetase